MRNILKKLEKRVEALQSGNQRVIVRYADGRLLELLKGVIAV